jgi:hypothetical protein
MAGVDGEHIENNSRGVKATECELGLHLEDRDEGEESLHGACRKGI